MRKISIVALLTAVAWGAYAPAAHAQIGPVCMRPAPFGDTFVLFFIGTGANQMVGSGRSIFQGNTSTMSTTLVFTGGTAHIGWMQHLGAGGGGPVTGFATVSLATGSGPGRCQTFSGTGGCTTAGSAITLSVVPCPAGALTDEPTTDPPLGPSMAGVSGAPQQ